MDNHTLVEVRPAIVYRAKRIFLQPDEAARFEHLLEKYSDEHGNYDGLALKLLDHGDANLPHRLILSRHVQR